MPEGRTVGGVAVVLITLGLLQVAASYSQEPADELVVAAADSEAAATDPSLENAADHEDPEDYVWDSSDVIPIVLDGDVITADGVGVAVDGSKVTITRGGTYSLSGVLTDGQVIVDSTNKKTVRLILDGADIRCSWSAPVIIEQAKKTVLVLAEGSEDYVADGRSSTAGDLQAEEPNAAIFSKDDLTVWGAGSLTVYGDVNDGISSKDGLIIAGGIIGINAVDDGIRGKDYLVVRGGDIIVTAGVSSSIPRMTPSTRMEA